MSRARPKKRARKPKAEVPRGSIAGAKTARENQIEALDVLWRRLHQAARVFSEPRRIEETPDGTTITGSRAVTSWLPTWGHFVEYPTDRIDVTIKSMMALGGLIDEARNRLLETGFDVPDAWLTIEAIGSSKCTADEMDDGRLKRTLIYDGNDRRALEQVCSEIAAAVKRLRHAPQAATGQPRDAKAPEADKPPPRKPKGQSGEWSAPLPLTVMMKRLDCENMDNRTFKKWVTKKYGLGKVSRQLYQVRLDTMPGNLRARVEGTAKP